MKPLGPGDLADLALVVFVGVFASVAVVALFAFLRDRARLRLAKDLLARGEPVPPGLFDHRATSELARGIVLVATALGIAVYFALGPEPALARAALIPGGIGIGYLVGHRVERRRVR